MPLTHLEITRSQPFAHDYERLDGTAHFAVDPAHPANLPVVDLDRAPRDEHGRVRFSAGFRLLRPRDPARSNRRLLTYVVNRGRTELRMNRRPTQPRPLDEIHPGDGFLMRHGWTVAMCGWQWDVVPGPGLIGLEAPQALEDGRPIPGQILVQLQPNEPYRDQVLSHMPHHPPPGRLAMAHRPYPAADVEEAGAVMTVRETPLGERRVVPRDRWRFARDVDGRPVPDDTRVWLADGFEPGLIYEVVYTTRACPVVGTGLLAVRDATSFLRYEHDRPIEHAYGFGVSQCGRFLRQYLHDGLNLDEAGRPAFDGLLVDVAGARRGEFNHRYAQPSAQHALGFGHLPPFRVDELLATQRARGGLPRVFELNTSSEYWRIDCSLIHTDAEGQRDVEPPPEARVYFFAGTQHGPGTLPLNDTDQAGARGANSFNVVDYMVLVRSLLVRLDRWVSAGEEPPPSAFPRLADGSAVPREAVLAKLAGIPGLAPLDPAVMPALPRIDLGPRAGEGVGHFPARVVGPTYRSYVSDVDAVGNEVAGIRLPDLSVPVATHTGWVARHPSTGGPGQLVDMLGSTVPLPATPDARARAGDPRPSIAELYRDREEYLTRVRAAAEGLVAARYLLDEDVEVVVRLCAERYDAFAPRPALAGG